MANSHDPNPLYPPEEKAMLQAQDEGRDVSDEELLGPVTDRLEDLGLIERRYGADGGVYGNITHRGVHTCGSGARRKVGPDARMQNIGNSAPATESLAGVMVRLSAGSCSGNGPPQSSFQESLEMANTRHGTRIVPSVNRDDTDKPPDYTPRLVLAHEDNEVIHVRTEQDRVDAVKAITEFLDMPKNTVIRGERIRRQVSAERVSSQYVSCLPSMPSTMWAMRSSGGEAQSLQRPSNSVGERC